jgi:ribosomal protein S18 acetylase RimI-like enzyme
MMIKYEVNRPITSGQFLDLLHRSGLSARRPVDDAECIAGMIEHSNLTVTAWTGESLVGIARSVTDFSYCCYISDLAVDREYQKQGIGKGLIARTQDELGPQCRIILLSAPAAVGFYSRIGMEKHPQAWMLTGEKRLGRETGQ